jgi:hypothetical protein
MNSQMKEITSSSNAVFRSLKLLLTSKGIRQEKSFLVMVAYSGVGLVLGALLAVVYGAILEFIYGVIFVSQYEGVFVVLHSPSTPIIGGILGGVLSAILVIRSSKSPS